MIKKFLNSKGKRGIIALSLLLAAPFGFIPALQAARSIQELSIQEETLYSSLGKFLFRTRSATELHQKKWADWCNEWLTILDTFPPQKQAQYANLKADLTKVRRWRNAMSIGSRLEKALAPYLNIIPQEILDRVAELDKMGMIELISASLKGATPNVPDTKLDFIFAPDQEA